MPRFDLATGSMISSPFKFRFEVTESVDVAEARSNTLGPWDANMPVKSSDGQRRPFSFVKILLSSQSMLAQGTLDPEVPHVNDNS